jgi:hypothetical protein
LFIAASHAANYPRHLTTSRRGNDGDGDDITDAADEIPRTDESQYDDDPGIENDEYDDDAWNQFFPHNATGVYPRRAGALDDAYNAYAAGHLKRGKRLYFWEPMGLRFKFYRQMNGKSAGLDFIASVRMKTITHFYVRLL